MLEFRGHGNRGDPRAVRNATEAVFKQFHAGRQLREANEATTRVELIDRVLDALGWEADSLAREVATAAGDFLDYELWVDRARWCVLEAKRVGETFELPTIAAHTTLVPVSRLLHTGGRALKDVLAQASRYCNDRAVPLACVSNGFQWLIFRGMSAERRPWTSGTALVFKSPEDVLARFDEFFAALARNRAGTHFAFALLERPAPVAAPVAIVPRDLMRTSHPVGDPEDISKARTVCDYLLADIYGDAKTEMLKRCYVEPGVSTEFERSIQLLLRDSARVLEQPEQLMEGETAAFAAEVSRHGLASTREPVLVVGHVGAGKTTFLHRALQQLRDERTAITVLLDLEGRGRGGSIDAHAEEQHVAAKALETFQHSAGTTLKNNNAPSSVLDDADPYSPRTLRALFAKQLKDEKAIGEALWESDETAWLRREHEVLVQLRSDAVHLLIRFLRHLHGRVRRDDGKAYPLLLIMDNLDQATDEYQRCMYGLAVRIARDTSATLVLCIREDTFVRGREPGGFLTSSTLPFVFHVAAPSLARVIRQRVKFAEMQVETNRLPALVRNDKLAVSGVCDALRAALLADRSQALEVLACLSGQNVRESLALARWLVLGSVGRRETVKSTAAYALESLLASGPGAAARSGQLHLFNCFDSDPGTPPQHALRSRLLAYLCWAHDQGSDRAVFESTAGVLGRFASWGYATAVVSSQLSSLISSEQVRPFSETERGPVTHVDPLPARISITARGYAHVTRLLAIPAYRAAMACDTRWYDTNMCSMFIKKAEAAGGADGPTIADIAESSAMPVFESYLQQSVASEDATLSRALDALPWVREVRSRSARLLQGSTTVELPQELSDSAEANGGENEVTQLRLGISAPARATHVLPTLRPEHVVNSTKWIPRILWALEFACRTSMGPVTPKQIATILSEHGNIGVPSTNVSRAFRDWKDYARARMLWQVRGKRYEIQPAGSELLIALLRED